MKRALKFLFILSALTFIGCSSDSMIENEIVEETISPNKIDFKINGQPPTHSIKSISATLCCDEKLSVSFNHHVNTTNGAGYSGSAFSLTLSKEGDLLGLNYKDFLQPSSEYYSPFFTPKSTLIVEDFEFVENQFLKFKISGQVFKKTYNFFAAPEFINIEATIEIVDFHVCNCNSFFSTLTTHDDFVFHSLTRHQQGNYISYSAYANSGYHIEFINFNENFRNMPLGVYSFDENTTTERIDFRKFVGVPRAFSLSIIPQEWLKYETSGNFEILESLQIGSETVTQIKFNLTAKENGAVIFEINDALIQTQL